MVRDFRFFVIHTETNGKRRRIRHMTNHGSRYSKLCITGLITAMGIELAIFVFLAGIYLQKSTLNHEHDLVQTGNPSEIESVKAEFDRIMKGYDNEYHLKLRPDYSIVRDDKKHHESLKWVIKHDGQIIREMDADGVLVLSPEDQWTKGKDGVTIVYLKARIDGKYEKVSKAIQYIIVPEKRSHQLEVFR